jgi:hypothetical protein
MSVLLILVLRFSGWLRASVRKINEQSPRHRDWLPHRDYLSTEVDYLKPDVVYDLVVEIWPTACIVSPGGKIIAEVSVYIYESDSETFSSCFNP